MAASSGTHWEQREKRARVREGIGEREEGGRGLIPSPREAVACIPAGIDDGESSTELLLCLEVGDEAVV
jgi:hypothetical protein